MYLFAFLLLIYSVGNGELLSNGIWRERGDIVIGFVTSAHVNNASVNRPYNLAQSCAELEKVQVLLIPAFRRVMEQLARNRTKFGGFRIGYEIIDSCWLPERAVSLARTWSLQKVKRMKDPDLNPPAPLAVIGGFGSRVTAPLAMLMQYYDIPVVDYGATSPELSNRLRYPLFARTVPSDSYQGVALPQLAMRLSYEAVHLVYSDGLYGELGAVEVRKELDRLKLLVASDQIAPAIAVPDRERIFDEIVQNFRNSSLKTRCVICFCEAPTAEFLLRALQKIQTRYLRYQILASDGWATTLDLRGLEEAADGAVTVTVGISSGLALYDPRALTERAKDAMNQDPWFQKFLQTTFNCSLKNPAMGQKLCNVSAFAVTANDLPENTYVAPMYQTIQAVTEAIDKLIAVTCAQLLNKTQCLEKINRGDAAPQLYQSILAERGGIGRPPNLPLFDANGDGLPMYEFNWYSSKRARGYVVVGSWINGTLTAKQPIFSHIPRGV